LAAQQTTPRETSTRRVVHQVPQASAVTPKATNKQATQQRTTQRNVPAQQTTKPAPVKRNAPKNVKNPVSEPTKQQTATTAQAVKDTKPASQQITKRETAATQVNRQVTNAPIYTPTEQRTYGGQPVVPSTATRGIHRNRPQNVEMNNDGGQKAKRVTRFNPDGTVNNRITSQIKGTGTIYRAGYPISLRDEHYGITRNADGTVNPNSKAFDNTKIRRDGQTTDKTQGKTSTVQRRAVNNNTRNTRQLRNETDTNRVYAGDNVSVNNLVYRTIV
jgi:hypothetical protein